MAVAIASYNKVKLTAQFIGPGHCKRSTHLLFTESITWPTGHPQPGEHIVGHCGMGGVQNLIQGGQSWNIWPSIEQPT